MSLEVLREALGRIERGERVALGTLVATRGSTPQKVGARVLVQRGQRVAGTLGGGAVEAEAIREAAATLDTGRPAVHDYDLSTGTDDWGLACGGSMTVLVESLEREAIEWLRVLAVSTRETEPLALVTIVEGDEPGTHLLVRGDGEVAAPRALPGSIRTEAIELGRRVLVRGGGELAPVAGGRAYAEAFLPPPALVVVGAGHVGKALAGLGRFLGVHVTVIDDRAEYASRARFPEADEVVAAPAAAALSRLPMGPATAVVVAMRNQDLDYEATATALRSRAGYVGLIGARRKAILVTERVLADGIPAARVRELRSPIGLDIGARTPEEIAVSIVAEWIMLRQGGAGTPLRLADDLFAKAARGAALP